MTHVLALYVMTDLNAIRGDDLKHSNKWTSADTGFGSLENRCKNHRAARNDKFQGVPEKPSFQCPFSPEHYGVGVSVQYHREDEWTWNRSKLLGGLKARLRSPRDKEARQPSPLFLAHKGNEFLSDSSLVPTDARPEEPQHS